MRNLFSYWHFDLLTMILFALICAGCFFISRFAFTKRSLYSIGGLLLLLLCFTSPLHFLGEHYLFSAHMAVHVMILLIAAPLVVAGIPPQNRADEFLTRFSKKIFQFPAISWLVGVGIMWVWHIPYVYDRLFVMHMDASGVMHGMNLLSYLHMFSLFFAGMIFAWPVIGPYAKYRISGPAGVLYLSTACIGCSLLGLLITFAPAGLYTHAIVNDGSQLYNLVRNTWHISAEADQQAAGLIMWVPCCFIYLSGAVLLLVKWLDKKETVISSPINFTA